MTDTTDRTGMPPVGHARTDIRYSAVEVARALRLEHDPTPEQAAVIEAPLEPLVVVAGAGSGKTETMAARVVWLVANDLVAPQEVLGLTFTRKAASELSARVERRLQTLTEVGLWTPTRPDGDGPDPFSGRPTIATYHSYAGSIVRDFGLRVGVEPTVRMLTEAATWQLAYEASLRFDGDVTDFPLGEAALTNAALTLSGELAEHLDGIDAYVRECARSLDELPLAGRAKGLPPEFKEAVTALRARCVAVEVARRYERLKRSRDALDFADQMALAARLAREFPDIATVEQERFSVVLLDEFRTPPRPARAAPRLFAGCAVTRSGPAPVDLRLARHRRPPWPPSSGPSQRGLPVPVLPLATSWRNADRIHGRQRRRRPASGPAHRPGGAAQSAAGGAGRPGVRRAAPHRPRGGCSGGHLARRPGRGPGGADRSSAVSQAASVPPDHGGARGPRCPVRGRRSRGSSPHARGRGRRRPAQRRARPHPR